MEEQRAEKERSEKAAKTETWIAAADGDAAWSATRMPRWSEVHGEEGVVIWPDGMPSNPSVEVFVTARQQKAMEAEAEEKLASSATARPSSSWLRQRSVG